MNMIQAPRVAPCALMWNFNDFNLLAPIASNGWATMAVPAHEVLAGIVVALALIPEAIGFSIIAGVDPRVGLYASVAIAIVVAFTGGRPGMISAATAAVAVLVIPLVRDHGVEYLFAATILMGLIQIVAGLARLDLLMQFVSRSVITGFVNALAILIFMAQLPQLTNVTWQAYAMVAAGLAIIYCCRALPRPCPSPLVAILVLSAISASGRARRSTAWATWASCPKACRASCFPTCR